jgi:tetratricopeptide (TPR) repeat protein
MLVRYALKSRKVMVQFGIAALLGLLGIALLFSTVNRWRFESTLREAIRVAATGDGDARAVFGEAIALRPVDPFANTLLAQWELERGQRAAASCDDPIGKDGDSARRSLAAAIKTYDEVLGSLKDSSSDSELTTPSAVGAVAARLSLADCSPGQRAALLEEATRLLEQLSTDDTELLVLRAAVALGKGDASAARKACEEASANGRLEAAGASAVASYYWTHGLVLTLARDPDGWVELERASMLRKTSAAGRALALSTRVACADPAVSSKTPDALAERCQQAKRMLSYHAQRKQGDRFQRFLIGKDDEARTWNAIGVGFLRAGDPDRAVAAWKSAEELAPKEPRFRTNHALALRALADHPPANTDNPSKWKNDRLADYAGVLCAAAQMCANDPDRAATGLGLLYTAAANYWLALRPGNAREPITIARDSFHLEDAEVERWLGAIADWSGKLGEAVPHYKKAIDLHHKDAFKMQVRVESFQRGEVK